METPIHSLKSLFDQLGLSSDDDDINQFIEKNGPIASGVELHEAIFWSNSQAALLREMQQNDADWAEVVDQLNVRLR